MAKSLAHHGPTGSLVEKAYDWLKGEIMSDSSPRARRSTTGRWRSGWA